MGVHRLICGAGAGYEAPAQFAEETRNAARNVPWAIVTSVVATALCGGLHLAALLFSVQACFCLPACSIWGCTLPGHSPSSHDYLRRLQALD